MIANMIVDAARPKSPNHDERSKRGEDVRSKQIERPIAVATDSGVICGFDNR